MANDFFGIMLAANIPALMGSVFYVDPVSGLDTYDGGTPARAFKTLTAGYAALTANSNDMLVLIGNQTSVDKLAATLDWAKDYTHLVGACAPVSIAQRARIFGHADNALTPLIKISGNGCSFRNIHVNYGVAHAESLVAVEVTGERNYFENCHFAGIGHSTQDAAGACSLLLNGAAECRFVHCSIGLDTQATRGADSSEILVEGATHRMFFEDCFIYAYISNAGHPLVKCVAGAADMTGTWLFKGCTFESIFLNNVTQMTEAFQIGASLGTANIILQDCVGVHIAAWTTHVDNKFYIANHAIDSNTDGIAQSL